mmetsp:Transcript_111617/g.193444  ORF Transcript_111617/g.193444 Transcript_111617/m.193444 type:complete len:214 (-) Transcript_111617:236-877(-)
MAAMVIPSMDISRSTLISKASFWIFTAFPLFKAPYISHGTGRPMVTSKMLEPILDEMAISPCPCRATITEVIRSGTDVPAARTVRPMMCSLRPHVSPMTVANQTIIVVQAAIQQMDMKKLSTKNFLKPSLRTSGMVMISTKQIGRVIRYMNQSFILASAPGGAMLRGSFSSSSSSSASAGAASVSISPLPLPSACSTVLESGVLGLEEEAASL